MQSVTLEDIRITKEPVHFIKPTVYYQPNFYHSWRTAGHFSIVTFKLQPLEDCSTITF